MERSELDALLNKLERLEQRIEEIFSMSKEALTFEQAWKFLKISSSQLYKLTCKRIIPAFKPGGKLLYFKRSDLENWMLSNRRKTAKERTAEALTKLDRKKKWNSMFLILENPAQVKDQGKERE